ncbi:E3 ubiquitin-protein ligase [Canna indica]|uniref:E3 ubiquitin-protein ligase n=1 Tax=Canna indica TaxID=4628 RepID=A0AAQ3KM48_9LILI|nr:E3 ubiquitin-protein ligase [Canna indica]
MDYCFSRLLLVRFLKEAAIFLSLVVKWFLYPCYEWRPASSSSEDGKGAEARARHSAAAQAVREALHVSTYGELTRCQEGAAPATCAVCLSEVRRRDRVWELCNCRHVFHQACLDRWLDHDERLSCPLCRALLVSRRTAAAEAPPPPSAPSWAVERLVYLFGDDLLAPHS